MAWLRDLFRRQEWSPADARSPVVRSFASTSLASGPITTALNLPRSGWDWQRKAWDFYDVVPEMRLVVGYRAAALSKVKLQIGRVDGGVTDIVDTPQTQAFLEQLFGGVEYHGSALARIAQHLTIVGGTYIVIVKGHESDEWLIIPPDQMDFTHYYTRVDENGNSQQAGFISFNDPGTGNKRRVPIGDINFLRIWQPHPRNFWDEDSPTRGAISTLEKIAYLDAVIKSAARSRLVGSGVWFLPHELSLPAATVTGSGLSREDFFKKEIHDAMTASLSNPDSAAAQSPILVFVPGEMLDKIQKPVNFWSEFDQAVNELRDTEIRRYAAGQPLPTEKITGVGDVNHWTDWHLSEEDTKFDIGPLASLITDAISPWLVQPVLGPRHILVPDLSDVASRPDRTPEAINLYGAGVITRGEARLASGYPEDLPDDEEQAAAVSIPAPRESQDPPVQPDVDEEAFAVADMLVRDVMCTGGAWLLRHTGREHRSMLEPVPAMERHVVSPAVAEDVLAQVLPRVREKYDEERVSSALFGVVSDYVRDLYSRRAFYRPGQLRSQVCQRG